MKVVIIGTGYVGLVTGACLAKLGHEVVCVDKDDARANLINEKKIPFYEPGLEKLVIEGVDSGRLHGSTNLSTAMIDSDCSIIAVGTPTHSGQIDLSYVKEAGEQIAQLLKKVGRFHTVILKSTCVPGTSDTLLKSTIEKFSGLSAGSEFGLGMNPEFLREGTAVNDFMEPDRIVLGSINEKSSGIMGKLYESFSCPKVSTSLREAEMIKYVSNAFLANLISFSNEIAQICENIPGLDEKVIMHGLHLDKRLNPVIQGRRVNPGILDYLRAGIGYGGSCFPKDTLALQNFAWKAGVNTQLLDAGIEINNNRAEQIVNLIENKTGSLVGRKIALLGVSFKPDTDDVRESPGIRVAKMLLEKGASIKAWDPVATLESEGDLKDKVECTTDINKVLSDAELAVITTGWDQLKTLNWGEACDLMRSPIIFDGRSIVDRKTLPKHAVYITYGVAP